MDYKLYPLPLSDINRPIYYMIKSFMARKVNDMPADKLDEEWQELRVKVVSSDYQLSFPSVDFSEPYDAETLQHEVVILKDDTPAPPTNYTPFGYDDDDDDDDSHAFQPVRQQQLHYFIDTNPDTNRYRLRCRRFFCEEGQITTPVYFNNTKELSQALNDMTAILWETRLATGNWLKRLQTARQMLEEHVNELHILHNAGLYDFHVLEQALASSSMPEASWRPLFNNYVTQLKVFAMHAVNNLSWDNYASKGEGSYDQAPPYRKEAIENERKRRQTMVQAKRETQHREQLTEQHKNEYHKKKNRTIRKNILIYMVGILFILGVIWLYHYSRTGTIITISGALLGIIIHKVRQLAQDYQFNHPLWFRTFISYMGILVAFGGIVICSNLSRFICEASDGMIGPALSFACIAALMAGVFAWSYQKSKHLEEKARRIYTLLMVFSACMIMAQCIGSITYSRDRELEQWREHQEKEVTTYANTMVKPSFSAK